MLKKNGLLFSLVELLIVIAVLVMLFSLLSPTLKKAIHQAYTIKCRENLKSIYISTMNYAYDYNDVIPPAFTSDETYGDFTSSQSGGLYGNYGNFMSFIQGYRKDLDLWRWSGIGGIKEPETFICPGDEANGIKYSYTLKERRKRDSRSTNYSHVSNVWKYIGARYEQYPHPDASKSHPSYSVGTKYTLPLNSVSYNNVTIMMVDASSGSGHMNDPFQNAGITLNDVGQKTIARDQGTGYNVNIRVDHNNGFNSLMFDGSSFTYHVYNFPDAIRIPWLKKH